jgi:hypothetical protein
MQLQALFDLLGQVLLNERVRPLYIGSDKNLLRDGLNIEK